MSALAQLKRVIARVPTPVWVLVLSGLAGFRVGSVGFPTWHVAVETGQVVAGLVEYPRDNPVYIYHTKMWTLTVQLSALLLKAGLGEILISKLISGVLGAISFQALSLLTYGLGGRVWVALLAPFFIIFVRGVEHGTVYPIALTGTDHTFGAMGLSFSLLVVSLLGTGFARLGGFLLGIAPAVHGSHGAWVWLITALAIAWDFRAALDQHRAALKYFAAGVAVTAVSLIVQVTMIYDLPDVSAAETTRYVAAFVRTLDHHRQPAALVSVGSILNLATFVLASLWLAVFHKRLSRGAMFLLRVIAVGGAASLGAMLLSWAPPDRLPLSLVLLMPARFLNFNILVFIPLVLALLAVHRRTMLSHAAAAGFAVALLFSYRSHLWEASFAVPAWIRANTAYNPWHVFVAATAALIVVGCLDAWTERRGAGGPRGASGRQRASAGARLLFQATLASCLALSTVMVWRYSPPSVYYDRTNDAIYAQMAAGRGVVATGGSFHLVQLYTRRPILLDGGAIDTIMYAPEGGPEMERIFRDVYDVDFFNPPEAIRAQGALNHDFNKPIWERHSLDRWRGIRHTYHVTEVLVRRDWNLALPLAAENAYVRLYSIPE